MGVRLPSAYQEVEYLESTRAGQYIDTLESVTNDIVVRAKFRFLTSYLQNYQSAFGAKGTSFDLQRSLNSTTAFSVATFGTSVRVNVNYNIYQADTIVERSINSVTINGVTTALSVGQGTPSGTIWLFGKESTNKSAIDVAAGTRIYSAEILSGNIVLKHFIPCYRKSDNEPGMYDLVSGEFFTNAGTGEFLVGPDVIDSISPWLVARRRMLMARFNVLSSLPEGVKIYLSETVGDVIENVPYIYLGLDDNGNARLLREKTEGARKYANGNSPDYATTLIDAWLENTVDGFLSRFDENVISSLVNTEIKYLNYSQNSSGEISSASRRCFLMSRTEVGFSQTSVGNEGKSFLNALKTYFNTTDSNAARVSKQNENAVSYWLRSAQNTTQMALVWSNGTSNRYGATYAGYYVRPALSLKADTRAKVKDGEYYI